MKFYYLYKIIMNSLTKISLTADPTKLPIVFASGDSLRAVKILRDK